jgi:hypothetical protein
MAALVSRLVFSMYLYALVMSQETSYCVYFIFICLTARKENEGRNKNQSFWNNKVRMCHGMAHLINQLIFYLPIGTSNQLPG